MSDVILIDGEYRIEANNKERLPVPWAIPLLIILTLIIAIAMTATTKYMDNLLVVVLCTGLIIGCLSVFCVFNRLVTTHAKSGIELELIRYYGGKSTVYHKGTVPYSDRNFNNTVAELINKMEIIIKNQKNIDAIAYDEQIKRTHLAKGHYDNTIKWLNQWVPRK